MWLNFIGLSQNIVEELKRLNIFSGRKKEGKRSYKLKNTWFPTTYPYKKNEREKRRKTFLIKQKYA